MNDNSQFSDREKEVAESLLQGKSNKQIALALGISASTVEYHLKNIYKKLQVSSRTEAVLRLGKSIGSHVTSELGKSTVEMNGETADNGVQTISTRRIPMNKIFVIIGGGLLVIALVVVLLLVNLPLQSAEIVPTNASSLPDLVITSAYVSMVDSNGRCLPYYGFNVTVVNQGNAPAPDVILAETNTGQEVHIGTLDPLQSISMPFVAKASSGVYTVIADPQNIIVESNETNNSASYSEATATPVAACLPLQFGDYTITPVSTLMVDQTQPTTIQQITPEPPPTIISTPQNNFITDPESPGSVILKSSEINASNLLKVDDGLIISDRNDCLPKDCALSVWNILEPDSLALSVSNPTLQLVISLRSFQTSEDAKSDAEKAISENGGRPGYLLIEVPVNILPGQSWAYAHDGWFVVVTTTYENMEISVSASGSTGGISDSQKAATLLANLARMQIDKLILAKSK